jgi:hypothetical protein
MDEYFLFIKVVEAECGKVGEKRFERDEQRARGGSTKTKTSMSRVARGSPWNPAAVAPPMA